MKPPDREMHTKGNHRHYTIIKGNLCDKESQNFAEVNRKDGAVRPVSMHVSWEHIK
jgi:hypothetical protein